MSFFDTPFVAAIKASRASRPTRPASPPTPLTVSALAALQARLEGPRWTGHVEAGAPGTLDDFRANEARAWEKGP